MLDDGRQAVEEESCPRHLERIFGNPDFPGII